MKRLVIRWFHFPTSAEFRPTYMTSYVTSNIVSARQLSFFFCYCTRKILFVYGLGVF